MALARTAIRGTIASWLGALGGFAVRFAVNATMARLIVPEVFGQFALAYVYAELIGILAAPCFSNCIVQFEEGMESTVPATLQLNGAVALAFACIGSVAGIYGWFTGTITGTLVLALCLIKALSVLLGTYDAMMQRELQFTKLAKYRMLGVVLGSPCALLLAYAGYSYAALLAGEVFVLLLPAVLMARLVSVPWRRVLGGSAEVRAVRARALVLGREMFWVRAIDTMYQRLDQLLLGRLLGASELGFYYQAKYIGGLPAAAVGPATQSVALRVFVKIAGDAERMRRMLEVVQVSVLHVLMLAVIVLGFAPRTLVVAAYGQRWAPVADILPFLLLWILLHPLVSNMQVALTALTRFRSIRISQIAQLVALALLTPGFVWLWGSKGAALALGLTTIVGLLALTRALEREQRPQLNAYQSVLSGGMLALIVGLSLAAVGAQGVAGELLRTGATILAYVVGAVLLGGRALREMIARIVRELRPDTTPADSSG